MPRQSLVEKWPTIEADRKADLFGDAVPDLDKLAASVEDLTDKKRATLVQGYLRQLDKCTAELDHYEPLIADLGRRRNAILATLVLLGEEQASLAERIGVSGMTLSVRVGASVKKR